MLAHSAETAACQVWACASRLGGLSRYDLQPRAHDRYGVKGPTPSERACRRLAVEPASKVGQLGLLHFVTLILQSSARGGLRLTR